MPPLLQAKLLHVLQDQRFSRLGSRSVIKVDVRILAATNINIPEALATKRLREDLYYRLNAFTLSLPPLRDRKEEIPILLKHSMTAVYPVETELASNKIDRELNPERQPGENAVPILEEFHQAVRGVYPEQINRDQNCDADAAEAVDERNDQPIADIGGKPALMHPRPAFIGRRPIRT